MLTDQQKARCFAEGMAASKKGAPRAPASNSHVMGLVASLSRPDFLHSEAIGQAMSLFSAGYQAQCDIDAQLVSV